MCPLTATQQPTLLHALCLLQAGDVLKFGLSSREYVLLHDEMVGGGRAR